MKVTIENLTLINFKKFKHLEITEFPNPMNIRGANESGKSSLVDAFSYLFFGKDSTGRSDFSIKTLDSSGNAIEKLDHEVSARIDTDGIKTTFKRVFREEWVKKRGEEKPEFSGHKTLYFVNEVPLNQGEFKAKVDAIMDEEYFRLLTNPLYFNSMKWDARRAVLFSMVDAVSDQQIASTNEKFQNLLTQLTGKDLEEYKKELASKRLNLKKSIDEIPFRVDEATRNMPQVPDIEAVNKAIQDYDNKIAQIEKIIEDSSTAYDQANRANQDVQNKIYTIEQQIIEKKNTFESTFRQGIAEKQEQKRQVQAGIVSLKNQLQENKDAEIAKVNRKSLVDGELATLRQEWDVKNKETLPEIDQSKLSCPTCNRPYEAEDNEAKIAEFETNWKTRKAEQLKLINEKGVAKKEISAGLEKEIAEIKEEIATLSEMLQEKEKELSEIVVPEAGQVNLTESQQKEIAGLSSQIDQLKAQIKPLERTDNSQLNEKKREFIQLRDAEKAKLSVQETIDKTNIRITELKESEKRLAKELADIEKMQFTIESFEKAKVDIIQEKINNLFADPDLTFRMFKKLINGGYEPCCDTMYKGVPFPDVNAAGKVWAGMQIINTISEFQQKWYPIWLDERESVTAIPETQSQVINLYVDPSCSELTFN